MNDNADPLHGWSSDEVADTSSGPATADIYGKLFFYIRGMLQSFLGRLPNQRLSFELFQVDAACLPDHLENNSFSRIEVSNCKSSITHIPSVNNTRPIKRDFGLKCGTKRHTDRPV